MLKRVVVTGMGALTPIGNDIGSYWEGISKGKSGAAPITYFDCSNFKTKFACELKGFSIDDFLERKESRRIDACAQYAIVASDEAIRNSGIDFNKVDTNRVGVIWGSGVGGLKTFQDEILSFAKSSDNNIAHRFSPFFISKMISDTAGAYISIRYKLKGVNFTTVSACASSANAIIDAFNYIRLSKADIIISGGSEAAVTESGVGGFNALNALSVRNDDPEKASRPFDKDRDGFVLGEGAGALVLEEYEHAIGRGANILAEIVGTGLSADAYHITAPDPDGKGVISLLKDALSEANLYPSEVDLINTHGTSTPLGDIAELNATYKVFGDNLCKNTFVNSTKSMTGHLLGAAGAIEAISCILSISNNSIPPTINLINRDEKIDEKINIPTKLLEKQVNVAISNTFGFGGHNANIIFKKI